MSTEQETTGTEQSCVKPDMQEDFTKGGKCLDELSFVFDNGQKLYVSQNFLHYASPVFKAMFEHDYEEKTTRTVKLSGKNRDDFLEFLLCFHPSKQKPVDRENVLRIATIAEEYQSPVVVERSKETMIHWLGEECSNNPSNLANAARDCLRILTVAFFLHYETIEQKAIACLGDLPYQYITGKPSCSDCWYVDEHVEKLLSENKTLYESLDEKLKNRILLSRLEACDEASAYHRGTDIPIVYD